MPLAMQILREVLPDRKRGCLCDDCLEAVLAGVKAKATVEAARKPLFQFDDRSLDSIECIRARTGCGVTEIVLRSPSGQERTLAIPNVKGNP